MLKKSVTGIEPATLGLEVPRAIQLRHTDPYINIHIFFKYFYSSKLLHFPI